MKGTENKELERIHLDVTACAWMTFCGSSISNLEERRTHALPVPKQKRWRSPDFSRFPESSSSAPRVPNLRGRRREVS